MNTILTILLIVALIIGIRMDLTRIYQYKQYQKFYDKDLTKQTIHKVMDLYFTWRNESTRTQCYADYIYEKLLEERVAKSETDKTKV